MKWLRKKRDVKEWSGAAGRREDDGGEARAAGDGWPLPPPIILTGGFLELSVSRPLELSCRRWNYLCSNPCFEWSRIVAGNPAFPGCPSK